MANPTLSNAYVGTSTSSSVAANSVVAASGEILIAIVQTINAVGTVACTGVSSSHGTFTQFGSAESVNDGSYNFGCSVWYLTSPSATTATVTASLAAAGVGSHIGVYAIAGADTTTPIAAIDSFASAPTSAVSNSIATTADDLVIDLLRWKDNGADFTADTTQSGQTEVFEVDHTLSALWNVMGSWRVATTTSTSMGWTNRNGEPTHTLVAVSPAAGGPTLTSPTGTATGTTTATIGATTDTATGTFYGFVSTSSTPPSAANLKAGTGAVWYGSVAVSSTGAKTLSATGLTAGTGYYAHLLHNDGTNDSNIVSSAQFTTTSTTKKLKLLVHPDAQGDTGVAGVVFQAPTGGAITGAKIGEFTGKTFEATLEGGKAVLKVPVADFGGSALTTSDTPVALVRNATDTTGIISGTVIEE